MIRIILFLVLIALAASGAAWIADQPGDIALTWSGWRVETTLPVVVLALGLVGLAAILAWAIVRGLWRAPERIRRGRRERRHAKGRHAITQGLLAIGHGDPDAARRHAEMARRHAAEDPLTLLLHAQSAQLDGNRDGAQRAFRAMAERPDTRLLGLRGLFIEAQRANDAAAAAAIAEEAFKASPSSPWASQAVLGFRCAQNDWTGALGILDNNLASGLIDKATYRRQRGVLLTARALELESSDRDLSRATIMDAIKLVPTLIPAAVLASKFESEAHQVRRAMRLLEAAWLAQPHPDIADAYAHVKLGDSARQRLVRAEALAAKAPGHLESALAVARAAIDASEFARAREALAPFVAAPTQRVAMLMAEIERSEHGDSGRARAWTLRAVRAAHDPVWTADGYVSDRWRPVSPVTGRLDAFQWQTPLAALPSDAGEVVDSDVLMGALSAPAPAESPPPGPPSPEAVPATPDATESMADTIPEAPIPAESPDLPAAAPPPAAAVPPPIFHGRPEIAKSPAASVPAVIPIIRAPDDPGVESDPERDEFAAQMGSAQGQAGGWRGFLSRWGV
ncbi:MAG TPA: heme biosynthesis HemY N-terminal domain-containing protein [Nitrobacter sp.]|nr:heme biosynthesis HemY N-terminal domain-containing protein [Nitrobacter sp.]